MISKFEAIKAMITVLRPAQNEQITDAHATDMMRLFVVLDDSYMLSHVIEGRGYPHILRDMVCTVMSM